MTVKQISGYIHDAPVHPEIIQKEVRERLTFYQGDNHKCCSSFLHNRYWDILPFYVSHWSYPLVIRKTLAVHTDKMGMLNTFEIFILNQYSEVPYGSTLHGQIVLDSPEDMEVTEISVNCYCRCRVELFDYRVSAVSIVDVHGAVLTSMQVDETLMHEVAVVFPPEQPESNESSSEAGTVSPAPEILSKGMHVFDFKVNIAHHLPASFEGQFGNIRYFMKAHVQCPTSIEYNTRYFKVIPVVDLNCLPDVEYAVEEEMETEIYSFFKSIGFYRAKMFLHKSGYVPGDVLHVRLDIHNDTLKDITRAVLKLKMVTTYRTKQQKRQTELVLCTSKLSPIDAGYTFHGCDRNLRIPKNVVVSNLIGYRYINVEFFVELVLQQSLLSLDNMKMCAKIEIGTIPICTDRLMASLILREPPPRYEDLLPRYEDAINLIHEDPGSDESPEHSLHPPDQTSFQDGDNDGDEPFRNNNCVAIVTKNSTNE